MANLSDDALLSIVNAKQADAEENRSEINALNSDLDNRYDAEPYGTEVAGRSKFVSNDVADAVNSTHGSLVRVFQGAGSIVTFKASNPNDEAQVTEAEEKTKYIDYLVRGQTESYQTQNGFLLEVLKHKAGYLKYYYEETESTEDHEWKGLSEQEVIDQLDALVADKNNKELKLISSNIKETDNDELLEREFDKAKASVIEQEENEDGTFDIKVRVKVKRQEIKIVGVPSGSLLISKGASSTDSAELVGDESFKTRGELLAEGHSKELVSSLPMASIGESYSSSVSVDELGNVPDSDFGEWSSELVPIADLYVLVDYNGDGIAERRNIQKSGDIILVNDPFDHVPYVISSAFITPHSAIGQSLAEQVTDIAEVNTAITRGMLDNIYSVNNVKKIIRTKGKNKVNLDEALSNKLGGVIQASGDGMLADTVLPILTPFIGDKVLLVKQHMDQLKANRVGEQLTSQGLDGDALSKETATRFTGVEKASQEKAELVARNTAEVGYVKLYSGVAWLAKHNQIDEVEISVLGKQLKTNPKNWKYQSNLNVEVGLGAGDGQKVAENMSAMWNVTQQLAAVGSKLTDSKKQYNILSTMLKATDNKDVSRYFNDPEEPAEQLMADNEELNGVVLQLQEQNQILQQAADNPLAEAEMVKREGDIAIAQGKLTLDAAKLAEDQRQFDIKTAQSAGQHQTDTAVKLTDIEVKNDTDVQGSLA